MGIVPITDLSGQGLTFAIRHFLEILGLDLSNMIGQKYDGAPAMSGRLRSVQAVIQQ